MTIEDFVQKFGMGMVYAQVDENPHMVGVAFPGGNHYLVIFSSGTEEMKMHFSMRAAHTEGPKMQDVLECLRSYFQGVSEDASFEDWAEEYGYDTDSRKAEKAYNSIKSMLYQFMVLVGSDGLEEFMTCEFETS